MKQNILKVKATIDELSDKGNKWADRGIILVEGVLVIVGVIVAAKMFMNWKAGMIADEKIAIASLTCFGNAVVIELWRRFRWLFYSLMVIMMLMSGIGYGVKACDNDSGLAKAMLRPAGVVMGAMNNLQSTVKGTK